MQHRERVKRYTSRENMKREGERGRVRDKNGERHGEGGGRKERERDSYGEREWDN